MALNDSDRALLEWGRAQVQGTAQPAQDPLTWAKSAIAEKQPILSAMEDIKLGDRARTLKAIRSLPKDQWPELVRGVQTQAQMSPKMGLGKRLGLGLATGAASTAQSIQELLGLGGTDEEVSLIRQLESAARGSELYPEGSTQMSRIPVAASEMVFPAVTMVGGATLGAGAVRAAIGAGALGTGAAGAAGAGLGAGALQTAGAAAGVTAAAYPLEYRQAKGELLDAGVDPSIAKPVAAATALVSGAVESIVPNPFKGSPVFGQGVRKAVSSYLASVMKQYPGELSEEFLQSAVHGAGTAAATWMDENAPDVPFDKQALQRAVQDTVDAAGPLALLMGVPAAAQVPSVARAGRQTTPQVAPQVAPAAQPAPAVAPPVQAPVVARDTSISPDVMGPPAEPPSRAMQVAQELERMPADALGTQFYAAQSSPRKPVWYDDVKRLRDADPQRSWRDIRRELVTGGRFADAESDRVAEDAAKQQEVGEAFAARRFENQEAEAAQLQSEGWKILPAGTTVPSAFETMAGEFGQGYYRLRRGGKKDARVQRTPDERESGAAQPVGTVPGSRVPEGETGGREDGATAGGVRGVPAGGQAERTVAAEPVVTDMMSVNPPEQVESTLPPSIRDLGDDEARALYRTMTGEKQKRRKNKQTGLDETYYQSDTADPDAIKQELAKILGGLQLGTNLPKVEKKPAIERTPPEPEVTPQVTPEPESGQQAAAPTTAQEAADAWAARERVGVEAGFDLNAIENTKQRILQVANSVTDEWKSLDEVTPKKIGRQAELRASVPKHLKDLRDLGYAQMAWDKQGNTYHAKAGVPLPEWLTQSEDDAVMASLPDRSEPVVEAAPIVSEAGEAADTAAWQTRESLEAMEILGQETPPPAKRRLGLRPMGAESTPPDRRVKRLGQRPEPAAEPASAPEEGKGEKAESASKAKEAWEMTREEFDAAYENVRAAVEQFGVRRIHYLDWKSRGVPEGIAVFAGDIEQMRPADQVRRMVLYNANQRGLLSDEAKKELDALVEAEELAAQPWMRSRGEYIAEQYENLGIDEIKKRLKATKGAKKKQVAAELAEAEALHKESAVQHEKAVREAHAAGKQIPESVLADYPHLKPKAEPAPAESVADASSDLLSKLRFKERATPAIGSPERAALDAEMAEAEKAQEASSAQFAKLQAEHDKTKPYSKKRETLKKRIDKARSADGDVWKRWVAAKDKHRLAVLEDRAASDDPLIAIPAAYQVGMSRIRDAGAKADVAQKFLEPVQKAVDTELRKHVAKAAIMADGADKLPAEAESRRVEQAVRELAGEIVNNPLLVDSVEGAIDRLSGRIRGARIEEYRRITQDEIDKAVPPDSENRGALKPTRDMYEFGQMDREVEKAKGMAAAAQEAAKAMQKMEKSRATANAKSLKPLVTKGASVDQGWAGDLSPEPSRLMSDGRVIVDTEAGVVAKNDVATMRRNTQPRKVQASNFQRVWDSLSDKGDLELLGVLERPGADELDIAVFADKFDDAYFFSKDIVAYLSRVGKADGYSLMSGSGLDLLGFKRDGKLYAVAMAVAPKKGGKKSLIPMDVRAARSKDQMRAAGSFSLTSLDDASPALIQLKQQPVRRGLRKGLTKEVLAELTHGRITPAEVSGMRGWHIEVGDSYMTALTATPENFREVVEADLGFAMSNEEWATMNAAGAFLLELPDGTRHSGLGFILLSEAALEGTAAHELLHLGRKAGLIGQREWQALVDKFAPDEPDAYRQEEMIANAIEMMQEREPQLQGILERVQAWVRRVLAKLGIGSVQSRDVFMMMKSAGYWAKAKTPTDMMSVKYSLRGARTESPEFKRWFGDSKVVDENGKPLVVYHGTTETQYTPGKSTLGDSRAVAQLKKIADKHGIPQWSDTAAILERWWNSGQLQEFGSSVAEAELARKLTIRSRGEHERGSLDIGFNVFDMGRSEFGAHFGTNEQAAARGEPFAFYLSIQNPLRLDDLGTWNYQSVLREAKKAGVRISAAEYDQVFNAPDSDSASRELLLSRGYDGIVYENEAEGSGDSWIVFSPTQIKSATGNVGTYDPTNPDIRYSLKQRPYGRPDLAKWGTSEEVRSFEDDVDEARNVSGKPRVKHRADVDKAGDALLAADREGILREVLAAGRAGQSLDSVEKTDAAIKLFRENASPAIRSNDPQQLANLINLKDAIRESRSETARILGYAVDPLESPSERIERAIHEAAITLPAKQEKRRAKALANYREAMKKAAAAGSTTDKGDGTDAAHWKREAEKWLAESQRVNLEWARKVAELKTKLKILGVDLDNLNEAGYSRQKAADVLAAIHHAKASTADKLYEYWRNSILSAPTTQVANFMGNTAHALWHFTMERWVETLANAAVGDAIGAQIGEYRHLWRGMWAGVPRGARNFMTTWRTEIPSFEYEIGRESQWKVEDANTAIGGRLGKVVRWPQRLLQAVDDFAMATFSEMEAGAYAYRIAKMEGKTGKALDDRVAQLVADVQSQAWDFGYNAALELTFKQKGGKTVQAVKRHALEMRRDWPGLRYLLPFVTTPVNIFATGIKKSPLGTLDIGKKMWENWRNGEPASKGLTPQMAQQVIAWAVVLALMDFTDPEDPKITGSAGEFDPKSRDLGYRTRPPQSIRLGDTWYSYSRLEPFATALGMTIDWINAFRTGDWDVMANTPMESIVGQAKNKTFLTGVSDLLKAMEADRPTDKAVQWASNFVTSWVPNIVRAGAREADETYMNRRVWGKRGEWWGRLGRRTLQKTEISGLQDYPIYDVWGRPANRSESPVGSDWLYRIMVPSKTQDAEMFVADRLILNYNNAHDEDATFPMTPQPWYTRDGKTRYMTDGQFADYVRLAGEAAVVGLSGPAVKLDANNPTTAAVKWIHEVTGVARGLVRDKLIEQWDGAEVTISAEELGAQAADEALGSLAWSVANSEAYDDDVREAVAVLAELKPDRGEAIGALRRKLVKAKRKAEGIRAGIRRLVGRWPETDIASGKR